MFDLVQKNKTAVQVVLGLVSLGLVVGVGISGYDAFQQDGNYLAKVGGLAITERELAEAANNQAIPDDMKPALIEQMVQQKLLEAQARGQRLTVTDESLREFISQIEAFQVDGKFDAKRYKELLDQQRMTAEDFESKVKRDLVLRQLVGNLANTGFTSSAMRERMEKLLGERREIQTVVMPAQDYVGAVRVSDAEIKKYYDANTAEFKVPEQVKVEFVALSQAVLGVREQISDADVQKYFDEHKAELAKEERKARHILIVFPKGAKPEQKAEAKKQAEAILAEVKQSPDRFADIAQQKSQDPGSARQGGDLGWFGRGTMVKVFEDTVFGLKNKGELSGVVESEFGFHIVKLEDMRDRALADLKPEVTEKLKAQRAQAAFQVQSEKFNEIVYQQADSLKPAAEALKVDVQKSEWVSRESAKEIELNNPKLLEALFSDDVLKKKHNTEAIEVVPGVLVSARVVEHKPAQVSPLAEVSAKIGDKLRMEKAVKKAQEEGTARLKELQAGKNPDLKWSPAQEVARVGNQQFDEEKLKAIYRVAADKLPGYVGGEIKGLGYALFKVVKVSQAPALPQEARQRMTETLGQMYGQVTVAGYLDALRKQFKVEYKAKKQE